MVDILVVEKGLLRRYRLPHHLLPIQLGLRCCRSTQLMTVLRYCLLSRWQVANAREGEGAKGTFDVVQIDAVQVPPHAIE